MQCIHIHKKENVYLLELLISKNSPNEPRENTYLELRGSSCHGALSCPLKSLNNTPVVLFRILGSGRLIVIISLTLNFCVVNKSLRMPFNSSFLFVFRSCTDVLCCMIFLLFVTGYVLLGLVGE